MTLMVATGHFLSPPHNPYAPPQSPSNLELATKPGGCPITRPRGTARETVLNQETPPQRGVQLGSGHRHVVHHSRLGATHWGFGFTVGTVPTMV